MASSVSSGLLVGYIKEIDEASVLPDDIADNDDPAAICLEHLEKICDVVKGAESFKNDGSLSTPDWLTLLHKADAALSSMCDMAYEKDFTDDMNPFGVGKEGSAGYIKTKKPSLGTGGNMQSLMKLVWERKERL